MNESREIINNLIPINLLMKSSGQTIIDEIALNIYKEKNNPINDKNVFYKLPVMIRDIVLIIKLDTELNMSGIFGFLENSTGVFLDDTIETLERIKAEKDATILHSIKSILIENNILTSYLEDDVDEIEENFIVTQEWEYAKVSDEIDEIADKFYLYSQERNIFDNLIKYIDLNKKSLIEELNG